MSGGSPTSARWILSVEDVKIDAQLIAPGANQNLRNQDFVGGPSGQPHFKLQSYFKPIQLYSAARRPPRCDRIKISPCGRYAHVSPHVERFNSSRSGHECGRQGRRLGCSHHTRGPAKTTTSDAKQIARHRPVQTSFQTSFDGAIYHGAGSTQGHPMVRS